MAHKGDRVKLVEMIGEKPQTLPPGTEGTVTFVDDAKQIHVQWDNGSTLALLPGEDKYEIIARVM